MEVKITTYESHAGHIGGAIRALREKRGLSQSELARQCGVHLRTISRHERGLSHLIDGELIERICLALHVTQSALWAEVDQTPLVRYRAGRPRKSARHTPPVGTDWAYVPPEPVHAFPLVDDNDPF